MRYDRGELLLSAEEGGRRHRKVRLGQAPQRGKLLRSELVDVLRRREILEPMPAEVEEVALG
jgi:hypothetical protein